MIEVKHIKAHGQATRVVVCERCDHRYEYVVTRSYAIDTIPLPLLIRSAERICNERLKKRLALAIDPIPCPSCGWMQSSMVPELRKRFLRPLAAIGVFFAIASAALALIAFGCGIWFYFDPIQDDINCFGLAAAGAGGSACGILLTLLRSLLARIRYPVYFLPRKSRIAASMRSAAA